ncbi:MAG: hypothetical protein N2235_05475 [Fischerella sp.]|nr:hypothetical protein [Fischerella sp.]
MLGNVFCGFCAWAIAVLGFCSIAISMRKGINYLKKLHQIPCSACEYFTNDYRLKCTVHPIQACTEEAINCRDFEAKTYARNACNSSLRKLKV